MLVYLKPIQTWLATLWFRFATFMYEGTSIALFSGTIGKFFFLKGPVPKTRKFKLYAHSEEFTSDRGSPKEHFNQKMRKKF